MKRFISILLALAIVFALCGCDVSIDKKGDKESGKINLEEALAKLAEVQPEKITLEENNLLCPAKSTEKNFYGYINTNGEWVIEPYYAETKEFEGDYAVALNGTSLYEHIDRAGNRVLQHVNRISISESYHFSDGMLLLGLYTNSSQKYLYVDAGFTAPFDASNFPKVGKRSYKPDYLFGLATPFKNGKAVVMRQANMYLSDGRGPETAYVIDKSGKITATLPEGLDPFGSGIDDNGHIIVFNSENRYGLCDINGSLHIECTYRFLRHCDGPLYLACNDSGFWGFINGRGETVIDFQYQKAMPFSEGLAAVYDGSHWGFISETGDTVMDFVFDDVASWGSANSDYSVNTAAFSGGYTAVKAYGYWAVIDKDENPVALLSEADCEGIDGCPFVGVSNGLISYGKNVGGKILYGVVTTDCKEVLEPQYALLGLFN